MAPSGQVQWKSLDRSVHHGQSDEPILSRIVGHLIQSIQYRFDRLIGNMHRTFTKIRKNAYLEMSQPKLHKRCVQRQTSTKNVGP